MALIEAHITKVEQEVGSEWGRISTDHDTVKQLSTKRPDLIREAAEFKKSGALVGIDYTEQTKRLDDGRTFRNYYYNSGGALGNGASAADDGIDRIQPTTRKTDPDDAWRMCLNKGGELAVLTLPLMPAEQRDFETQKTIARAWAQFFYFEPRPSGASPSLSSRGAYYEPEPDQSIPF
jgi:hypothetical protein